MSKGTRARMPGPEPKVRRMMRIDQVADALQVHRSTVYRMLDDGQLEGKPIRGARRVFADSLEAYQAREDSDTVERPATDSHRTP